MILVRIYGGLGNQMFQYATGRHLALVHNTALKYDDGFFEFKNDDSSTKRDFELKVFNTHIERASEQELDSFLKKGRIQKRLEDLFPFLERRHLVNEKFHPFNPEVLKAKNSSYLNGYWQSEKYFSAIREVLVNDFSLKNPFEGLNKELAERCRQNNTVAIHIRRGDYVSNPKNTEYHGLCTMDYYYAALELLKKRTQTPLTLFVFSDDAPWVNEHFRPGCDFTTIDWNKGKDGCYDLHLMSLCHHNIIANSSFSWWGAWLNTHGDKLVVAPKTWFATKTIDSSQIVPESWIRI